ncbi:hypothetical protein OHC33_008934 [Knufia fluminis]|uniref:Uncharacterized protein n=1 Tax=Knufia fluminis TaxID=191047 RepID=A0AAN8EEZ5_9EURO|nr:hypothetical protein OHC33_008934 [Knufia fluminis]
MPTTLLSLPVELRLKIYEHVLTTSNIHSFRPQRKIGWNRPHADLSNPPLLFESDAHPTLRQLFHSKLTKLDHTLILTCLLHHAKVLLVDHTDFISLQKLSSAATLPSVTLGLSSSGRTFANIVKQHLRTIDFSDKLDEIVCQPADLIKILKSLPGLRTIHLASKHVQRYSGTIEEHVEFARERAEKASFTPPRSAPTETSAEETRRLTLRSPVTDGSRMTISPALFVSSGRSTLRPGSTIYPHWVTVDLSMLTWQHFLYTGAPYRDHWRTVKMRTLLESAEERGVNVVFGLRCVEFDPSPCSSGQVSGGSGRERGKRRLESGMFRGEMSSVDWILRLKQRSGGAEYAVRQRRRFDEVVGQEGCGLVRCSNLHKAKGSSVCELCNMNDRG